MDRDNDETPCKGYREGEQSVRQDMNGYENGKGSDIKKGEREQPVSQPAKIRHVVRRMQHKRQDLPCMRNWRSHESVTALHLWVAWFWVHEAQNRAL